MPEFNLTYTEKDLIRLVMKDLESTFPNTYFEEKDIKFLVQSKQNYRVNTWENGMFKAEINVRKE